MGNFVRDFRGNELEQLENTPASDTLVGEIDDYIGEWEDKASDLRDLASNAETLIYELQALRDKKQDELDAMRCVDCGDTATVGNRCGDCDELAYGEECRCCDEPAVINGLCGDCNKMVESKLHGMEDE